MNNQKLRQDIENASPFDLTSILQDAELYDKKSTREVIDEIYAEFQNGDDKVNNLVEPIFFSVINGFMECSSATRKLRRKGITADRLILECRNFSYNNSSESFVLTPDGYTEYKNARDYRNEDFKNYAENVRPSYDRKLYEDKDKLDSYKDNIYNNNGGKINAKDEYTGKNNIYRYQNNPDARRNIETYKHSHQANVDHIVPLKKVHEQFKSNYALSDEDIKNISNQDYNYALTAAHINNGTGAAGKGSKGDMTNSEFVRDQNERAKNNQDHQHLSEETKERMIQMEKDAQKSIEKGANKAIAKNIIGTGTGNTEYILKTNVTNALNQSKDYMVGNVIMYIIKPLYYEISDIVKNGLEEGVNADSTADAFRIRFSRLKNYVIDNFARFIGDNILQFIKGFISSFIEGIIGLFVGIFKQTLKLIKEGIRIIVQSGKILFGKESNQKTPAEKGDAIVKLLGAGIINIAGIGIEALLNKIGIGEPWSIVFSTMLSGIASALFMVLLDKADLFSIKAEKRYARIEEIFNERIKDIKEARDTFNIAAIEKMRQDRLNFDNIINKVHNGFASNKIEVINEGLYNMADFMKVDLPYSNNEEFVEFFDSSDTLEL